jgi:hypothetical protein
MEGIERKIGGLATERERASSFISPIDGAWTFCPMLIDEREMNHDDCCAIP